MIQQAYLARLLTDTVSVSVDGAIADSFSTIPPFFRMERGMVAETDTVLIARFKDIATPNIEFNLKQLQMAEISDDGLHLYVSKMEGDALNLWDRHDLRFWKLQPFYLCNV